MQFSEALNGVRSLKKQAGFHSRLLMEKHLAAVRSSCSPVNNIFTIRTLTASQEAGFSALARRRCRHQVLKMRVRRTLE